MYELSREIPLSIGSASYYPNNLTVYYHETKNHTYAAVINTINWDTKMDGFTSDRILIADPGGGDRPLVAQQCKLCPIANRSIPLLAVASAGGALIFDAKTNKLLAWQSLPDGGGDDIRMTRGISYVDNLILIGTHIGDILLFSCGSGDAVNVKPAIHGEHTCAIADIGTCHVDDLTCSADIDGTIIVWSKNMKSVAKKISTKQSINCINVLRKQVICGTVIGQLLFYSTVNGELMAEVNAHARQINAIAVAHESAYVLSVSDDSFIRVWKLHTRKPEPYQVEHRYSAHVDNAPLVGAQFANNRGTAFILSAFDYTKLFVFNLASKKTQSTAL